MPAALCCQSFFVGHVGDDGCAPHYLAPLLKRAAGAEGKAALPAFLFKGLVFHCLPSSFGLMSSIYAHMV